MYHFTLVVHSRIVDGITQYIRIKYMSEDRAKSQSIILLRDFFDNSFSGPFAEEA